MGNKAPDAFADWWSKDGQYLDPDTSDVPWFDKRRGLAEAAYLAGATLPENKMRCTICGFIVDTRFEATKPSINFGMGGRTK